MSGFGGDYYLIPVSPEVFFENPSEISFGTSRQLNEIARHRGQTLAEMALAWVLRDERMTSVIVGASSVNQLADNLQALNQLEFTAEELNGIERILNLHRA
jgi:L-glyceraldehyde 3-phosphate reductase